MKASYESLKEGSMYKGKILKCFKKKPNRGQLLLEQNQKNMAIGQSSTGRIDNLNETRENCSRNWKEHKEKV